MGWRDWWRKLMQVPAAEPASAPAAAPAPRPASPLRNPAPQAEGDSRIDVQSDYDEAAAVTFVHLDGTLTADTSDEFESKLRCLLDEGRVHLVVDMSGVPYVSSRGWGILVSLVQAFRQRGGDIQVTGMSLNVLKLFRQTGLAAIFQIYGQPPSFQTWDEE